ncbi:MAG: methyltransferase domain-containing protein [Ignavibacteriaceae bacterium]|nr:methyltransferase domain-containing protein [Ignavibacteriaceae bacterium]
MTPNVKKIQNDNRNYDYSSGYSEIRREYSLISELIIPNSKVIDLGCGNGTLLHLLKEEKQIDETGIEISESGLNICNKKKLNVVKHNIDSILPFKDNYFDYSICNVTIQMVMFPEILLSEMKRISKYQILSFPNFAYYKNRLDMLLNGRMPRPMLFDYKWHNTGHIHQFSFNDLFDLLNEIGGLKVKETSFAKTNSAAKNFLIQTFPNLFMAIPIFYLEKVS